MAKINDAGLKQLPNGNWSYRIYTKIDGKSIDTTCRQDENGNPFKTKKAARDARDAKIFELKHPKPKTGGGLRKAKVKEIWAEYLEGGASSKAEATIRKQKSMWENHIEKKFGNRYVDEITQVEIEDYLSLMYYDGDGGGKGESYSYKYVEGFLKFFYLLLGRAYDSNCISTDMYTKMCMNRGTRISMPPITQEDNEKYKKIKIFTPLEIQKINLFLQGSNFHVSFMLGYMLGIRRSECFGLIWDDVDWEAGTITIQR